MLTFKGILKNSSNHFRSIVRIASDLALRTPRTGFTRHCRNWVQQNATNTLEAIHLRRNPRFIKGRAHRRNFITNSRFQNHRIVIRESTKELFSDHKKSIRASSYLGTA